MAGRRPLPASNGTLLFVLNEPTPYWEAVVQACGARPEIDAEALYLEADYSQAWGADVDAERRCLHLGRLGLRSIRKLWRELSRKTASAEIEWLCVGGWSGHWALPFVWLFGALQGLRLLVISDTFERKSQRARNLLKRALYRRWFRLVDGFLASGAPQAKYLVELGIPVNDVAAYGLTVDVRRIRRHVDAKSPAERRLLRRELGASPESYVLVFVGRLIPDKGLRTLAEAFQMAAAREPDLRLWIVGDGPERDALIDGNQHAVPNRNMRLLGRLPQERVFDTLWAADAFVLPAVYEPWGLVVIEALAVGRPVIVSDQVGCSRDVVVSKQNGLVVPVADAPSLADAILELASNRRRYARSATPPESWIEHWSVDSCARRIAEFCVARATR